MNPYDTKPWYASKAVWGSIVAILVMIGGLFGYTVSPADQASLVTLIVQLVGLAGSFMALVGRLVASKRIEGTAKRVR